MTIWLQKSALIQPRTDRLKLRRVERGDAGEGVAVFVVCVHYGTIVWTDDRDTEFQVSLHAIVGRVLVVYESYPLLPDLMARLRIHVRCIENEASNYIISR